MVYIVINLTPLLTGIRGTLSLGAGEVVYPLIDLPPSENGAISVFVTVANPELEYTVIFPEQTIEGVTYSETASQFFTLITNALVNVTLTPKAVTPPPPEIPPISGLGLGLLVAVIAGVFIFTQKKKK